MKIIADIVLEKDDKKILIIERKEIDKYHVFENLDQEQMKGFFKVITDSPSKKESDQKTKEKAMNLMIEHVQITGGEEYINYIVQRILNYFNDNQRQAKYGTYECACEKFH
jgi:hypothetical protein